MKQEYEEFLTELCEARRAQHVESCRAGLERCDLVRAACNDFTKRFVEKFPHLRRQAGFYGSGKGEMPGTEHWWCVDTDGTIVDPTIEQFSHLPGLTYTPYDETKHVIKIGRCMECGWDIHGLKADAPKYACSDECKEALDRSYL